MRAANAALVAGIVIVIAALSGASFAAEDSGRTAPEDVVTTEEVGDGEPAPAEATDPAEPADEEGGRVPEEVETEPVEPTYDGGRGGEKEPSGGGKDRPAKRDKRDEKEPLADIGVDMVNITFKPKSVTVKPGDEVTWTNKDTAQHNAVGQGAADFDTGLLEKGETGTVPFNDTGSFRYICTVHPTMKGEVVVSSGGPGGDDGGKGGNSSGTSGTSSGTGDGGSVFPSGSSGSGGTTSSGGGGSLPNTGQAEIPLLLLGSALIVFGLLARAFREYWIWR